MRKLLLSDNLTSAVRLIAGFSWVRYSSRNEQTNDARHWA